MTERDALRRELLEAEALHASLIAMNRQGTDKVRARWISEAEQVVTKLRERVARMEATG
jgi:hypothetical protein